MRRAMTAALAALFLWAPFAESAGRVAVISVPHSTENSLTTAVQRADQQTSRQRALLYTRAFLDAHAAPGSYDVIPARFVQTSRIRFGLVNGWNGDTAYAAVIWNGLGNGITAALNPTAGCFPCSLTITGMLPTVPQLFIGTGNSETEFSGSTSCSLMTSDCQDPGSQGPSYSGQRVHLSGSRDVFGWIPGTQGSTVNEEKDSTIVGAWPAGGTYVVMGASLSNMTGGGINNERVASARPAWRDSIFGTTYENRGYTAGGSIGQFDARGVYIADRMNAHKRDTTFARIVYAHWLATAVPTIGGDDAVDNRPTGNPFVVWAAIAHLDSISGFAVLGRSPNTRAVAFQVSGGLSRGAWNSPGGLRPSDPNFAPAVDSLAALGIPFAVGVPANAADSLATYASDLTTWARATRARFALSATLGTKDTTVVGAGNASTTKAFDLFGRFRSRIFWSPSDSSVYTMLVAARVRLDSLLSANSLAGRRDNLLIAGQDDYSPRNWAHPSNCRDSLASVARLAGFTGIAVNPEDDSLDVANFNNPRGLRSDRQGWGRATIGAAAGERFLYAAFPGYNPRGAVFGNGTYDGNSGLPDDSSWVNVYSHRALWGLYLPSWAMDTKDGWVVNAAPQTGTMTTPWYGEPTTSYTNQRSTRATGTNLVRITASSLGYGGNGPSADMPGFYQVKYTVNMCRAINALAGRTLIRFVYPGELSSADFRR